MCLVRLDRGRLPCRPPTTTRSRAATMPDRHPSSVHQQRQRSKIRRGQKQAVYRPWSRTILARQRSGDPIERHTARTQGAFGSEERQIVEPTAVTLAVKERHHDRGTEVHIVRLAGSLRSAPHNRVLLRAAAVRTQNIQLWTSGLSREFLSSTKMMKFR